MIHQNEMLSVPSIKWLGVYPTDIESFNLQSVSLTNLDRARIKSLLTRSYINSNKKLLQQVTDNKSTELTLLRYAGTTYIFIQFEKL